MVKRVGHLKEGMVTPENIRKAYKRASAKRGHTRGVMNVRVDEIAKLETVRRMLDEGTYRTSEYRTFDIVEGGKVRHIAALPFYPDRIVHWAVILATEDVFVRSFISQTYAAIPGRGTHQALRDVQEAVRQPGAIYCAKFDVSSYFASIDKTILLEKVARRIKDPAVLALYREIITGYGGPGIPIGNLTSQYLANLYLSDIDHLFKERLGARWYFRYMDDIIILGWSKAWLRRMKGILERELTKLKLNLNPRWQIFPIQARGVDFVGYRIWPDHILLRNRTKRRLRRKMRAILDRIDEGAEPDGSMLSCIASYHGILRWCDGYRLHRAYVDPCLDKMETRA